MPTYHLKHMTATVYAVDAPDIHAALDMTPAQGTLLDAPTQWQALVCRTCTTPLVTLDSAYCPTCADQGDLTHE